MSMRDAIPIRKRPWFEAKLCFHLRPGEPSARQVMTGGADLDVHDRLVVRIRIGLDAGRRAELLDARPKLYHQ